MASFEREVMNRLVRVESKLVRGFEELGVNIDADNDWLTVDDASRVAYIATLGRSMTVLLSDMVRLGAEQFGKAYDIIHRGELVGTIILRRVN
jgi:hypothetical protein